MPELPEVETVARQLEPLLSGRRLRRARLLDRRLGTPPVASLVGHQVERVFRLGKQVAFELSRRGRPRFMAVHLRMTGRLIWQDGRRRSPPDHKHLRARFDLDGGRLLFFDPRRFGTIAVVDTPEEIAPCGVDPLSAELTPGALAGLLRGSRQAIKAWLLRQDRLVGLGNIYACEILFRAGVAPDRAAGRLRRTDVERLHRALRDVLTRAIESCGTTFSDFQDARGVSGSYQRYLGVYAREGEPCPACGRPVRRIVQQQRSTFYCPGCQR
jgi:formamidopyrimidine-DNA glycosylase